MTIYFEEINDQLFIRGNTYPHKESIKQLGARFQGAEKAWFLPATTNNRQQVESLIEKIGGPPVKRQKHLFNEPKSSIESVVQDSLTISQLMQNIDNSIQASFPSTVWILGEIQNLNFRQAGCFFTLAEQKDEQQTSTTTVGAKIWGNRLDFLRQKYSQKRLEAGIQEGLNVRIQCKIELYRDRGFINLQVIDIDLQFTKGQLAIAREKLLKELRSKGLDQQNKRIPLTSFPFKVGLITAKNSRAESDFKHQLHSYGFPGEILFFPAQMQGSAVTSQVVKGIEHLIHEGCDIIVLTRGGGSSADLRWFDSREIALAIAHSTVPIVAAIGHHDDVCIAEEICHLRQKTPTAAADYIVSVFSHTKQTIDLAINQLREIAMAALRKSEMNCLALQEKFTRFTQSRIQNQNQILQQVLSSMQRTFDSRFFKSVDQLNRLDHQIQNGANQSLSRFTQEQTSFLQSLRHQFSLIHNRKTHECLHYSNQLEINAQNQTNRVLQEINDMYHQISAADPKRLLARGWTRLENHLGTVLSVESVQVGEVLRARLQDGSIELEIKNKTRKKS